jgi:hypothetical protein
VPISHGLDRADFARSAAVNNATQVLTSRHKANPSPENSRARINKALAGS